MPRWIEWRHHNTSSSSPPPCEQSRGRSAQDMPCVITVMTQDDLSYLAWGQDRHACVVVWLGQRTFRVFSRTQRQLTIRRELVLQCIILHHHRVFASRTTHAWWVALPASNSLSDPSIRFVLKTSFRPKISSIRLTHSMNDSTIHIRLIYLIERDSIRFAIKEILWQTKDRKRTSCRTFQRSSAM